MTSLTAQHPKTVLTRPIAWRIAQALLLGLFVASYAQLSAAQGAPSFPLRATYPGIQTLSSAQVHDRRDNIVLIHAGDELDYQMLRIIKSVNLPVYRHDFIKLSQALYQETQRPLVYYCHDPRCKAAYQGAQKALDAGLKNVFVYDAGTYYWAKAYPEQTRFLDKTPAPTEQLLSTEQMAAQCLPPKDFSAKVNHSAKLLDVRRPSSSSGGLSLFPGASTRHIPLSKPDKIRKFIQRAQLQGKTLLIYGEDTEQPRSVFYLLQQLGLKNAYSLCNGADRYFDKL